MESMAGSLCATDCCIILQIRTLQGHTNEKNFVGLTVNSEYIACGSETNEVFVYHKVRPWPAMLLNILSLHTVIVDKILAFNI